MRRRRGREPCSLRCGLRRNGSRFFLEKCHVGSVGAGDSAHDAAVAAAAVAAAAAAAAWTSTNFGGLRESATRVGRKSSGGRR